MNQRLTRANTTNHAGSHFIRAAGVVFTYALIAVIGLHQQLFHLDTHIPGSGYTDYYHQHWGYWWMRHAIDTGGDIYTTDYVFYPFESSLALHPLAPVWYPLWALIEPFAGTVAAMSAVYLVAFTLCGSVFYLLLRREGVATGLALVGGVMFQLTEQMWLGAEWVNISLMGWFWLPGLVLLWGRLVTARRPLAWVAALAAALWAMVLTDVQYPVFALPLVAPVVLLTLWRERSWLRRGRLVGYGLLAVAVATVLLWFVGPLAHIAAFDRSGLSPTPVERAVAVQFPLGYVWRIDEGAPVGVVVLPLLVAALLLSRVARRARETVMTNRSPAPRGFWLALVLVPLVLSAGGFITVAGAQIRLPYYWLHVTFDGLVRYPERFVPVFVIPAVIYALQTLTPLLARPTRPLVRPLVPVVLLLVVLGDARLFTALPVQPVPTPYTLYEQMGAEPHDYVVLAVPTGGSSGEGMVGRPEFSALQWYGMTHGKRMINGHISRVPVDRYWYLRTDDELLAWLGQRRHLEPDRAESLLREYIFAYPVGTIAIHSDLIEDNAPTEQEIIGYFNQLDDLLCHFASEGDLIVYRTVAHPDGCPDRTPPLTEPGVYAVDIGSPGDERYIGWGWHWRETVSGLTLRWSGEYPQTDLYVDLPPGDYTLSFAAQAFWGDRAVTVRANDAPLGMVTVTTGALNTYTLDLPAALVGDGQHLRLTFDYDAVVVPAEVGQSGDPRRLAIAVDWVRFAAGG